MSNTSNSRLNELMTIRDILMGEIISEYNERFEVLEKELEIYKASVADKHKQLDEQLAHLGTLLEDKSEALSKRIEAKTKEDRNALGAMLLQLGQQLKES